MKRIKLFEDFTINEFLAPKVGQSYDVKVWFAPDPPSEPVDPEYYEPFEGTVDGEEGWYWAKGLKFIRKEGENFVLGDTSNHDQYEVEVAPGDLGTDLKNAK